MRAAVPRRAVIRPRTPPRPTHPATARSVPNRPMNQASWPTPCTARFISGRVIRQPCRSRSIDVPASPPLGRGLGGGDRWRPLAQQSGVLDAPLAYRPIRRSLRLCFALAGDARSRLNDWLHVAAPERDLGGLSIVSLKRETAGHFDPLRIHPTVIV